MNPVSEIPVITPTDYTGMTERELLIRLDGKVDTHMAVTTSRLSTHSEALDDHEERIRKNEDAVTVLRAEVSRRVTPAQLWAFVLGGVGAAAAVTEVVNSLIPHK